MLPDFNLFSPFHLATLAAIPLASGTLVVWTRRYPGSAVATRITLSVILIVDGIGWYGYRYVVHGIRFPEILPLELCDAAFWLTAAALLTLEEHTFDLAYYWGVAGSGMALLTPYLRAPLHTLQSLQYFAGHALVIVGVLYLIGSRQSRPRARSWWVAFGGLNLYGIAVAAVDFVGGTNFMYLRQKPLSSSVLDFLGPWPWYIAGADLIALILFWLLQQPFRTSLSSEP